MADDDADQHQRQEQVVVERDRCDLVAQQLRRLAQVEAPEVERVDLVQALGAVGDVDRLVQVVQEHPDDFAEAQRHDGQVVAAQLERGRAQQDAEEAGQRRARGNHDPQRHVQALREHGGDRRESSRSGAATPAGRTCRRRWHRRRRSPGPAGRHSPPRCSGPGPAARTAARVSAMRTQALPCDCSSSGSTSSATRPHGHHHVFVLPVDEVHHVRSPSGPVRHALAQQARGTQGQHDDQHDESEDVGVLAAQHAAGRRADVARADRLDQPQQDAARPPRRPGCRCRRTRPR